MQPRARAGRGPRGVAAALLASLAALLASAAPRPARAAGCPNPDDFLQVLDFHLDMDPSDWEVVRHDATFALKRPGAFRCGDEAPLPATVRRKRAGAIPSDNDPLKPALKIDLNDLDPAGRWHGHRKIGLENGISDPALPSSLLREGIAWILMARAGAIAGGVSWVRLHVNGADLGVYLRVEEVDESFLDRHLGDHGGFLYKLDTHSSEYKVRETRIGEPDPFAADLCFPPFDTLCPPPAAGGLAYLVEHLDVHQLVTLGAVNTALGNGDGLLEADNNYFWYNSGRPRLYFPWDLDQTIYWNLQRFPHASEVERELFVDAPELRPYFDRVLLRLLGDLFSPASVDGLLDDVAAAVGPALDAAPLSDLDGGAAVQIAAARAWLHARVDFLRKHIAPQDPEPLVINEVLARGAPAADGGETPDWVELYNRGAAEAPLDGLLLSDDPAAPEMWPLPAQVLPPGGRLVIVCDDRPDLGPLHAGFKLDGGGEAVGLYRVDGGLVRALDFVRFGSQEAGVSLGRFPDGAPGLRRLRCPTPGAENRADCPAAGPFVRGDVTADGTVDLTDAAAILAGLFAGGSLPCLEAADVNDDGRATVTDAVHLLRHLFLGGAPPPPPFPACGGDPTPDGLGCLAADGCPHPKGI